VKRISKKWQKVIDEFAPMRMEWLSHHPRCWRCGARAVCIHEFVRGSDRHHAFRSPACWYAACPICNGGVLNVTSGEYLRMQLAEKLVNDPDNFDLQEIIRIRGWGPNALTLKEVVEYVVVQF